MTLDAEQLLRDTAEHSTKEGKWMRTDALVATQLNEFDIEYWQWMEDGAREDDAVRLYNMDLLSTNIGEALRVRTLLHDAAKEHSPEIDYPLWIHIPEEASRPNSNKNNKEDDTRVIRLKNSVLPQKEPKKKKKKRVKAS